jgi:molecular chaperone DnaK (HSP70)
MRTGRERSVEVKPSYGLTDEEIERLLEESIDFAEEDVTRRLLIEARTEADTQLHVTEKQLHQHTSLLQPGEGAQIQAAIQRLREAREGEDYNMIRDLLDVLSDATAPFAQRIMDTSIQEALGHKRLSEV